MERLLAVIPADCWQIPSELTIPPGPTRLLSIHESVLPDLVLLEGVLLLSEATRIYRAFVVKIVMS
jgi:hypothetical protein